MAEKSHLQVRIDPTASMMLAMMAKSSGLNAGDLVEAGVFCLLLTWAKQGKIGGDMKAKLLSMEQRGVMRHQRLTELLADSDGLLKQSPPEPVIKRKPGRPKKAKPIDPLITATKAAE